MTTKVTAQELQEFVGDGRLKQLEEALSKFNLFEAIGATHGELCHSNLLAFLLNPNQNHGLGDSFAREFLTHPQVLPELADSGSFEHLDVLREHQYTDILIIDRLRRYAIVIENKIWSGESGDQLATYWETIGAEFPDLQLRGVYLTPGGQRGSDSRYLPLGYRTVAKVLEGITDAKDANISADVKMVISHYVDILRRFIVGNADTNALARQIYLQHSQAIGLMNPELWQKWIKRHVEDLIKAESSHFVLDAKELRYIRFAIKEWDKAPVLRTSGQWTSSHRIVLLEFYNFADSLSLHLFIGPGQEDVREKLCELCRQNNAVFNEPRRVDSRWWEVYRFEFLGKSDYATLSDEELTDKINLKWANFIKSDLPRIKAAFRAADWVWQPLQ